MKLLAPTWIAVCVAVVTLSLPIVRAEVPPPQRITSVEGITEYRLGNGLQLLLFPDPSKPTVTVNLTYFVGSRHEGYGETGMAHLLEHMVFKGTPTYPQIWKTLQDRGAQFNGTTGFDRTNYFETLPATEENLEFALSLEADRMVNSNMAKKDLDSEFSVVRNEFEMGENNPLGVLQERIWSTAYLWHNYGKSTIGSREDIERVPIDRLTAFYRKFYQPDNAMLVVAGKFEAEKALTKINEIFGSIPRPTRVLEKTYTVEPAQDGEREVILRRVGDVQAVGAVYHICAGSHEDMPALEVLANIMQATQTGRLYRALVETQMATRISASADSLFDPGLIGFDAEVPSDKPIEPVRKTLIETVEGLASQEIASEEVDRARNAFQKRFEQMIRDSGRVGIGLSNWAAQGDWRLLFLHRDRMGKVTPADVKRVAALYLKPSNRTVGLFLPTKQPDRTKVPATPDLAAVLKNYKGETAMTAGEEIEATPAAIEARTQRGQLVNGIKTALLPKKTRGGRATIELTLRYGSEEDLKGRAEAAGLVAAMLERGTTKHSRRQLEDEFDRLKATVNIGSGGGMGGRRGRMMGSGGGSPGVISVSIDSPRESLPAVAALVGEMLREPAFPQAEFDKLQRELLGRIEQSRSEPGPLASIALRQRMSPYPADDVRHVATIEEQIERLKALKVGEVKKVYGDLIGAGYGELAAVGDFDPAVLAEEFSKMLKGWKSPKPFARITMPYKEVSADQIVINTPDKAMALMQMGTSLELRDDDPDYPAVQIGNVILGSGANSRLVNRLRQKEGFSYTVSSMLMANSLDRSARLTMFANCSPESALRCADAAYEELEKFLKDGATDKELEDAKLGYAEQLKVQLSNDIAVAGMLARQAYLGRTMKFTEEQLAKTQSLTVEQVNAAVRRYIRQDKLIRVRAGDFR